MPDGHTTGALPPSGPGDEEGNLRRDIADELADHLELASRSEMLRGKDEADAQRAATSRFGNPSAIAGRLYFAAMKGKIMRQNIQTAAIVCMAVAVIILGVMSWMALRAGQRGMTEAMTINNEAMLNAITAMNRDRDTAPATADTPDPMAWAKLTIQLVDEEGKPFDASGFRVTLGGALFEPGDQRHLDRMIPTTRGIIETGLIRTGEHQVNISSPDASYQHELILWPGEAEQVVEIQCPTGASYSDFPPISINWPEDDRLDGVTAIVELTPSPEARNRSEWNHGAAARYVEIDLGNRSTFCLIELTKQARGPLGDRTDMTRYRLASLGEGATGPYHEYDITQIAFVRGSGDTRKVASLIWYGTRRDGGGGGGGGLFGNTQNIMRLSSDYPNKEYHGVPIMSIQRSMEHHMDTAAWALQLRPSQWEHVLNSFPEADLSH